MLLYGFNQSCFFSSVSANLPRSFKNVCPESVIICKSPTTQKWRLDLVIVVFSSLCSLNLFIGSRQCQYDSLFFSSLKSINGAWCQSIDVVSTLIWVVASEMNRAQWLRCGVPNCHYQKDSWYDASPRAPLLHSVLILYSRCLYSSPKTLHLECCTTCM